MLVGKYDSAKKEAAQVGQEPARPKAANFAIRSTKGILRFGLPGDKLSDTSKFLFSGWK